MKNITYTIVFVPTTLYYIASDVCWNEILWSWSNIISSKPRWGLMNYLQFVIKQSFVNTDLNSQRSSIVLFFFLLIVFKGSLGHNNLVSKVVPKSFWKVCWTAGYWLKNSWVWLVLIHLLIKKTNSFVFLVPYRLEFIFACWKPLHLLSFRLRIAWVCIYI